MYPVDVMAGQQFAGVDDSIMGGTYFIHFWPTLPPFTHTRMTACACVRGSKMANKSENPFRVAKYYFSNRFEIFVETR